MDLLKVLMVFSLIAAIKASKCLMYLTGQHDIVPESSLVAEVTHVALAFMPSSLFNEVGPSEWPLFTSVDDVRPKFAEGTTILIAIGGWGDTDGFSRAARSESSRKHFADNVKRMLEHTGADGVDIDWEYPGGNGEDYKRISNNDKTWEIEAYPKLLEEIRSVLGPDAIMSAAVPGLRRDMLAFTKDTMPSISTSLDFLNVMAYDLMNRRDNVTKHHTGLTMSLSAVDAYIERGLPAVKVNLGFAFYTRWYRTADGRCDQQPLGCSTVPLEDPETGADLGQAGAFAWHDKVPSELLISYERAMALGHYDFDEGGHCFWDSDENIFWSWDTPFAIERKVQLIAANNNLGGVFAWGLGEDAEDWSHLEALNKAFTSWRTPGRNNRVHVKDEL